MNELVTIGLTSSLSQKEQLFALIGCQVETVKAGLRRMPQLDKSLVAFHQKLQAFLFYNDLLMTSLQQVEYLLQKPKQQTTQDSHGVKSFSDYAPSPFRNDEKDCDDNEIPLGEQFSDTA